MEIDRFKKLKTLLDQKKDLLRDFYSSEEFTLALNEIKTVVNTQSYFYLESQDIGTSTEHAIDSIFLVQRSNVFKMHSQSIPSFHLFFEDLVFSKYYQDKVMYSVELKKDFLFKKGNAHANSLN
jgi:hypothetical protein